MGFFISLIASVVASWLTTAIISSKSQRERESESGTKVNKQSNISQLPVVYGERKISGTRVFVASSGSDNTYLYIILALCEGEINSIGDVYIDDKLSTDFSSGLVNITKYLGTDTQAADSIFVNASIGWTGNHTLKGVAYLAVRLKWNADAFSGIPNIEAVVKGRKIYNGSTIAYSTNPAWVLRDYLTNSRFGKALPASFINDAQFSAAATKCDAMVTPYTGGTQQKIFECNVILKTDQTVLQNTKIILSGFRALMPYQNGKYGVIVEDQGSSSFAFNEKNIAGSLSIQGVTKKARFNRVTAVFDNPNANWQSDQIQYPESGSTEAAEYLLADGGVELEARINLNTVTNVYMAQDIAEITLKRSRIGLSCKFTATSEALNCAVGDIVDVTHSTPGWSAKTFRVNALSLKMDGTVSVELIEHQNSIYPWSTKTEADDIPGTNLPNPFSVAAPLPNNITEELYTTVNSKGTQSRAFFSWAAPQDAFVVAYEAEYKINGSANYIFIGVTSALEARIDDIPAGEYDFRVRSINSMGAKSDYASINNKTISGLTAVPGDVNNFSIRALDGQCHLTWSRITDLDVINGGYVRIRHSSLVANSTWEDGQDIGEAIAGSQTATVLPLLAGTYMAKAVDEGGRFSTNAKIAVTTVPNIVDFNAVLTTTENPSFGGVKDNMLVANNILKLDGAPRFILSENSDFLIAENGDRLAREIGDIGVIESSGSYYFANSVDLGQTYTSRLTAKLASAVSLVSDLIDYRTANIDTWQNFDGASSDAITAVLQIRTTQNNPASNPTWTDWAPFLVGDYHARGFEFRVIVTNTDSTYNINITALAVTIDMPDRVEKASDLSVSASSTAVSFGSNFKAVPVIGVTMNDSNSGDYFRVTSKARTGFTVQCFNSSNTGIARSINWQAIGYGKEAA